MSGYILPAVTAAAGTGLALLTGAAISSEVENRLPTTTRNLVVMRGIIGGLGISAVATMTSALSQVGVENSGLLGASLVTLVTAAVFGFQTVQLSRAQAAANERQREMINRMRAPGIPFIFERNVNGEILVVTHQGEQRFAADNPPLLNDDLRQRFAVDDRAQQARENQEALYNLNNPPEFRNRHPQ